MQPAHVKRRWFLEERQRPGSGGQIIGKKWQPFQPDRIIKLPRFWSQEWMTSLR
jgi:hypothetical protein